MVLQIEDVITVITILSHPHVSLHLGRGIHVGKYSRCWSILLWDLKRDGYLEGFKKIEPEVKQNNYSNYPIGSMYAIYSNIYHQYTPVLLAYIPYDWILWVIIMIMIGPDRGYIPTAGGVLP